MSIKALNSVAGFSVGEDPTEVILANGDITTTNAALTGKVVTGSIFTDDYRYANGTPVDFMQPSGGNLQLQFNLDNDFGASDALTFNPISNILSVSNSVTANTFTALGNISAQYFFGNIVGNVAGNLIVPGVNKSILYSNQGTADGSSSLTFDSVSNVLGVLGNITADNLLVTNSVSAASLTGTLLTGAQPNITSIGTLTNLTVLNDITSTSLNTEGITASQILSNTIIANDAVQTSNISAQNLQVSNSIIGYNQVLTGSLSVTEQIITGNLQSNSISANGNLSVFGSANLQGTLSVKSTTVDGNLSVSNTLTANTLSTNNLSITNDLSVTGNITGNNLITSSNATVGVLEVTQSVNSSLSPSITDFYSLGTDQYKWKDLNLSANGVSIGQSTITDNVGTLLTNNFTVNTTLKTTELQILGNTISQSDVTILGNLTVGGSTTYLNVDSMNIKDPIIPLGGSEDGGDAEGLDGKDRGLLLHNFLNDGSAPVNHFFGWKSIENQFIAVSDVASYAGDVIVPNQLANIKAEKFVGNLEGRVLSSNQPNITAVGSLTGLTVAGNANVTGATNLTSLRVNNILYPINDGSAGQVLTTNGSGSLYFAEPINNEISNNSSNVFVYEDANVTVSVNGNANVLSISSNTAEFVGSFTANTLTSNNTITLGITNVGYSSLTTSSTLVNQVIASVPMTNIRGVEFFIKGEQTSGNKYSVESISAVHNGTNVEFSKYGAVNLGGATGSLSVRIFAGMMELVVTPSSSNVTVWTTQYRTI